jgi:hypothetical protein
MLTTLKYDARKATDPVSRLDANEGAFFKRELEHIKQKSYDAKYKELKGLTLIPISAEANIGATEITWRKFFGIGFAKIISDYANDFPRVDTYGEEATVKIKGIGSSYGYSIKEIRQSIYSGKRLDQRRANFARRANDEEINAIAISGDTASGLNGLINYPGITGATILADGTGAAKTWASKTPDQIIRDVNTLLNAVVVTTNARELPDTLLLPLTQYNDIATRRVSSVSDTTVMEYILRTSPYLKKIDWLIELAGAGALGVDRALVYCKDEDHLTLEIPQPFEQFDPQMRGMEYNIPCHSETAGVIVYYPLSIAYGDGI